MKNKIIYLVILTLFISFVYACPEGEVCPNEPEQYTFDQFQEYYQNSPELAAEKYPDYYMKMLSENPQEVSSNPQAYETVIKQDVKYLNQNRDAFISYAQSKYLDFTSIGRDFSSFDVSTGRIEIRGENGKLINSVSFEEIKLLQSELAHDFKINSLGELSYRTEYETTETVISGLIEKHEGRIYVSRGSYSYDGIDIEINGDNRGNLLWEDEDGQFEIEARGSPITLPNGILISGKAVISDNSKVDLLSESKYQNKQGVAFQVSEKTRIIYGNFKKCNQVDYSCILDPQNSEPNLVVRSLNGNKMGINAPDGYYKSIIVKQIDANNPSRVDLRIRKGDGSKLRIIFSENKPITQGILSGMKTNIGHIFKEGENKYPWLIVNGKTQNVIGETKEELSDFIISSSNKMEEESIKLILETVGNLDLDETEKIIAATPDNYEILKLVINSYDPTDENSDDGKNIERVSLLRDYNSQNAQRLKKELIGSLSSIPNKYIYQLFMATKDINDDSIRKEILEKRFNTNIPVPGRLLQMANTDDLKRYIISKINIFEQLSLYKFDFYLQVLKLLNPELQELALKSLHYNQGIFHSGNSWNAYRQVLLFTMDNPKLMEAVLDKMSLRKDFGFNPAVFKEVYFDKHFQEQTKDLDSASKYSIALTAQRYLEEKGSYSSENRITAIDLIIEQRKRFFDHHVLDKDTYYIPLVHEENINTGQMVTLARESEVREIADQALVGAEAKERFLDLVENSGEHGKTTIQFAGHGGPNHIWLSGGQATSAFSNDMKIPIAISYEELGDKLANRGDLGEITILLHSCYSNDFGNNLYKYLFLQKGVSELPIIITGTNRGEVGFNRLFKRLVPAHRRANRDANRIAAPLKGSEFLELESEMTLQDLSVTVPIVNEEEQEYSNIPGMTTLGSEDDAGESLPPQKPEEEEKNVELPPTVIEIAKNEQEMEERLAMS
jgi:hypothetical protein